MGSASKWALAGSQLGTLAPGQAANLNLSEFPLFFPGGVPRHLAGHLRAGNTDSHSKRSPEYRQNVFGLCLCLPARLLVSRGAILTQFVQLIPAFPRKSRDQRHSETHNGAHSEHDDVPRTCQSHDMTQNHHHSPDVTINVSHRCCLRWRITNLTAAGISDLVGELASTCFCWHARNTPLLLDECRRHEAQTTQQEPAKTVTIQTSDLY